MKISKTRFQLGEGDRRGGFLERDGERRRRYLMEVGRVTEATGDFRRRIPDKQPDDTIDRLLEEEKNATRQAEQVAEQNSQDLKDCRRSLEFSRRASCPKWKPRL
ncbi:hypothetical protein JTE90_014238 [Oedothorax gibbosus]|uniref:Uncharacterized protein n=1 Tax=Oedothorax gibbosus TaxID=931172 RepID=A0AAV6TJT7_9ARAC|nr:hypothetical protein JTE90_014238 [Oedothorax gibbosus]